MLGINILGFQETLMLIYRLLLAGYRVLLNFLPECPHIPTKVVGNCFTKYLGGLN